MLRLITARHPRFWYQRFSIAAVFLYPFALLYSRIVAIRSKRQGQQVAAPVVCVGNVLMGGSGKTPTVKLLALEAKRQRYQPAIVLRGYGGNSSTTAVDNSRHSHIEVGDEALLHARDFPTWVGRDRFQVAQAAVAAGANFIIMDDGLQHSSLHKDVSILMYGHAARYGNHLVFPAGPLREPLAKIWQRVDVCLVTADGDDSQTGVTALAPVNPPIWQGLIGKLISQPKAIEHDTSRVIAFCGIADPNRFFAGLQATGLQLVQSITFPDHHEYQQTDLTNLGQTATRNSAVLVTTAKDAVRLPLDFRSQVTIVEQDVRIAPDNLPAEVVRLAKIRYLVREKTQTPINAN